MERNQRDGDGPEDRSHAMTQWSRIPFGSLPNYWQICKRMAV
jgi:hypothetical protein